MLEMSRKSDIPIPGMPMCGNRHSWNADVIFRISVLLDCSDSQISHVIKLASADNDISVPSVVIAIFGLSKYDVNSAALSA